MLSLDICIQYDVDCDLKFFSLSVVMNDVNQWRASIGLWYCHQISKNTPLRITTDTLGWMGSLQLDDEGGGNLIISLVLFLLLLLVLSGDIELNPGPKLGKH